MNNKKTTITFSSYQFILGNSTFKLEDFSDIKEHEDIQMKMGEELISVEKATKKYYNDNRFILFSFDFYIKWPYSEKVISGINGTIEEKNNPRSCNEMELKDKFFVLLDINKQRIYLSNRQKESYFSDFLKTNNIKDFIIRPIILEIDFVENINSISEVSFTVASENVSRQDNSLVKKISEDLIYNFGASEATLSLRYKKTKLVDRIKDSVKDLVKNKKFYKNLTIIGRGVGEFEKVFNLEGVMERISINTSLLPDTKDINEEDMVMTLILRILRND